MTTSQAAMVLGTRMPAASRTASATLKTAEVLKKNRPMESIYFTIAFKIAIPYYFCNKKNHYFYI